MKLIINTLFYLSIFLLLCLFIYDSNILKFKSLFSRSYKSYDSIKINNKKNKNYKKHNKHSNNINSNINDGDLNNDNEDKSVNHNSAINNRLSNINHNKNPFALLTSKNKIIHSHDYSIYDKISEYEFMSVLNENDTRGVEINFKDFKLSPQDIDYNTTTEKDDIIIKKIDSVKAKLNELLNSEFINNEKSLLSVISKGSVFVEKNENNVVANLKQEFSKDDINSIRSIIKEMKLGY